MKLLKKITLFLIGITFAISSYLRHKDKDIQVWESEIWADVSGYYVYLPAAFIHSFNPYSFPNNSDKNAGNGFQLDYEKEKVITKYPMGLTILQSPFFLFSHFYAYLNGFDTNGFSKPYYNMINISAWFYFMAGLIFLGRFLDKYFRQNIVVLLLLTVSFCTHVYYYTVDSGGMSHIYSFFLVSALLYYTKLLIEDVENKKHFILVCIFSGMILLVRPINIIALGVLALLDVKSINELFIRIKTFLQLRKLLTLFFIIGLILLPQFLYYKYAYGKFFQDSYEGEGFIYWNKPKIYEVLLQPENGLFLYTPIFVFLFIAIIWSIFKKKLNAPLVLITTISILYLTASWHSYQFGCAFSARNFVEYSAIMILPFGYFLEGINQIRFTTIKFIIYFTFILCGIFSVKLSTYYRKCFFGDNMNDWKEYRHKILERRVTLNNDYEGSTDSRTEMDGNNRIFHLKSTEEYSEGITVLQKKYTLANFRWGYCRAKFKCNNRNSQSVLSLSHQYKGNSLAYHEIKIADANWNPGQWQEIKLFFVLPKYSSLKSEIKAFFWNKGHDDILIDDLQIEFH